MNLYESVKNNLKEADIKLTKDTRDQVEVGDILADNTNRYVVVNVIDLPRSKSITVRDEKDWRPIYGDPISNWYGTKIIKGPFVRKDGKLIKEAEMQSLFDIVTDDARRHNNYAHYSSREVDNQDIKNIIKDLKRKGGREVKSNVYVLEDFIYDLNGGITVSENNTDEYKVVPITDAEKPVDYLDDIMLNEFTDDYYKCGEDNHEWTKDEMEAWIIGHKEDNPDTTIDLIHLDNLLDFQHDLYKQDKEDGMLEEAEGSGNIEYATPNYTGGSIYVYTGKLKDGNYFMASDEALDKYNKAFAVRIVNEDPDTAEDPNQEDIAWFPEWQEPRLVKDLEGKEALNFTKEILNWIITNKPDGNYQMADMKGMLDFVEGKSDSVY